MGRAARRAQERADRRQRTQQRAAPPRAPRISVSGPGGADDQRPRARAFKPWTWHWVADILSELRKVTWPTRQETTHLTTVVLIVSLLVGVVLGSADIAFSWFIEQTILRGF